MSLRQRPSRAAVVFTVALVCALLAAGTQGYASYRDRDRAPVSVAAAGIGEPVRLGGTTFVVRSITVAPELPARDPERPEGPVRGPAGSVFVLVVYSEEIDASVDLENHACTATLIADDGTVWEEDDDYGYQLRRPEALVCSSTDDDDPLRVGVPREVGSSFLIPARYADQVRWRLSVGEDRHVMDVRR